MHTHIPFWILSASHCCFISSPLYYSFLPMSPLLTLISFHFVWSFTEFSCGCLCYYGFVIIYWWSTTKDNVYSSTAESITNQSKTWHERIGQEEPIPNHWLTVNSLVFGRPIAHAAIKAWLHWLCRNYKIAFHSFFSTSQLLYPFHCLFLFSPWASEAQKV